eukprot:576629-Pleurochrysis_carterae.AAC.1
MKRDGPEGGAACSQFGFVEYEAWEIVKQAEKVRLTAPASRPSQPRRPWDTQACRQDLGNP